MSSPKALSALRRLGADVRAARLRRAMAISDLAARSGASPSTLARLERGDPGVAIGTLANVLLVLGLVDRLSDLFDVRNDNLGLALSEERLPQRGRTFAAIARSQKAAAPRQAGENSTSSRMSQDERAVTDDIVDPDGVGF